MNALGGHLEANARRLIAFIGQKQNRFGVLIQMPGIGSRSGPAIAFVFDPCIHYQIASSFDARDLHLPRPGRCFAVPIILRLGWIDTLEGDPRSALLRDRWQGLCNQ